jgi:quercetin dioxygenase-like cupin family protein
MKKKTMQAWFVFLFVFGLVIGFSLPGNWHSASLASLKPGVYDLSKKIGQLNVDMGDFKYGTLLEVRDLTIQLFKVDNGVSVNSQEKNKFAYVMKGKVKVTIENDSYDAGPGFLIVVPSGALHSIQRVGDAPAELLVFSSN